MNETGTLHLQHPRFEFFVIERPSQMLRTLF
jgi:hypothetical protein